MTKSVEEFLGTGRRKCAIAKVRISAGTGIFMINGKAINELCLLEHVEKMVYAPLKITDMLNKVNVRVSTLGGGVVGQACAISLGLARALEKMNSELRPVMKEAGMFTRDSRVHERKKAGRPGARKRFQFSKR